LSWIQTIQYGEAEGPLEEIYQRIGNHETQHVAHVLALQSLDPTALDAHHKLYRAVMRPTRRLRGADREMIATVVSQTNGCHY